MDPLDEFIDTQDVALTDVEIHMQMRPPHIGAQVNYVLSGGRSKGQIRPAFVVRNWEAPDGRVNLQVMTDAGNDYAANEVGYMGFLWATSVHYSASKEPHTWHWPE